MKSLFSVLNTSSQDKEIEQFILNNFYAPPYNIIQISQEEMVLKFYLKCDYSIFPNVVKSGQRFVFWYWEYPDRPLYYKELIQTDNSGDNWGVVDVQNKKLAVIGSVGVYKEKHPEKLKATSYSLFNVYEYTKVDSWEEEKPDKVEFVREFKKALEILYKTKPELFILI